MSVESSAARLLAAVKRGEESGAKAAAARLGLEWLLEDPEIELNTAAFVRALVEGLCVTQELVEAVQATQLETSRALVALAQHRSEEEG